MFNDTRLKTFRLLVQDYRWIHTGIGLFGNGAFLVGSVFFLWDSLKLAGIWLFIIGAAGMFVGSIGDAIVMETNENSDSAS